MDEVVGTDTVDVSHSPNVGALTDLFKDVLSQFVLTPRVALPQSSHLRHVARDFYSLLGVAVEERCSAGNPSFLVGYVYNLLLGYRPLRLRLGTTKSASLCWKQVISAKKLRTKLF